MYCISTFKYGSYKFLCGKVKNALPNNSMQIVSSKIFFTDPSALMRAVTVKNNQNNGDSNVSESLISALEVVPGITDSKHTNTNVITEDPMKTARRHLYLSVMAPIIGLIINAGIGCSVNIKPTANAE